MREILVTCLSLRADDLDRRTCRVSQYTSTRWVVCVGRAEGSSAYFPSSALADVQWATRNNIPLLITGAISPLIAQVIA